MEGAGVAVLGAETGLYVFEELLKRLLLRVRSCVCHWQERSWTPLNLHMVALVAATYVERKLYFCHFSHLRQHRSLSRRYF